MTQAAGDRFSLWKSAYEIHGPAVLAFLASRLDRREDAEDLLHDTFVHAIRASENLRDESRVRPFLFQIAHNLMVNQVRRPKVISLAPVGNEMDEDPIEQVPDDAEGPEETVLLRELEDRIEQVVEKMPEAHRTAFEMGVLQQKPYAEIARITGWTLAQVKINVYRARRKAIEELRGEWAEDRSLTGVV